MADSLRSRLVEAGARALVDRQLGPDRWPRPNDFATKAYRLDVEAALDAMLSCLTENADEWAEETRVPTLVGGDALALLAVLRNPE